MSSKNSQEDFFAAYASRLQAVLASTEWSGVAHLAQEMRKRWEAGRRVFFCGNGGSAGNAIHLVNDFLYGVAKRTGGGMKVLALSANPAVITCLANDVGYESIFSEQLAVHGEKGDLLIVLSGSGNSPNIVKVLEQSKTMGIKSFAILGYSGGRSKSLADEAIHFSIDDMQISEDMQLIVGHMIMQWLYENNPE
ncbi:MAG: SIS domain-containing protein [Opitutae bacterium]|nr:SIS domain-containing protein [Opitutae bacterium]